jgi:hypothetical protein
MTPGVSDANGGGLMSPGVIVLTRTPILARSRAIDRVMAMSDRRT